MARLRDPERTSRNDGFGHIPYPILAQQFLRDQEQHLVPFLGAGASRPAPASAGESPSPIDPALLAELTTRLNVTTDDAKMFLEIALAVLARLNAAVGQAVAYPELRSRFLEFGVELTASASSDAFMQYIQAEFVKKARLAREAGIRLD